MFSTPYADGLAPMGDHGTVLPAIEGVWGLGGCKLNCLALTSKVWGCYGNTRVQDAAVLGASLRAVRRNATVSL